MKVSTGKGNTLMDEKKEIYIGSDHAGFKLKKYLMSYLGKRGYKMIDMGNEEFDKGDDYPDYALKVAKKVAETGGRGMILCDSGVGVSIVANKVKGIRAVNAFCTGIARQSREHINTNILCMGQNYIAVDLARKIVNIWLETEFSPEERHHRRVSKIHKVEK